MTIDVYVCVCVCVCVCVWVVSLTYSHWDSKVWGRGRNRTAGTVNEPGFESYQGQEIFLFSKKTSRLAVWSTHSLIQWVPGVKWSEGEDEHSSASRAQVKNKWSYTSTSAFCLHGAQREGFTFDTSDSLIRDSWRRIAELIQTYLDKSFL